MFIVADLVSISYQLSLGSLSCIVLSGRCTQGLLYVNNDMLVVSFHSSGCSNMHGHRSQLKGLSTNYLFQE